MTLLDRRNVLLAGAGISGIALARGLPGAGLDLADPRVALDAYVNMRAKRGLEPTR